MSEYYPDCYQFLRISSVYDDSVIYKLFAVWVGGYAQGDSWKINSGITQIFKEENSLRVSGYSGSTYVVNTENKFMSSYGTSVLTDIIKRADKEGIKVELVSVEDVLEVFK